MPGYGRIQLSILSLLGSVDNWTEPELARLVYGRKDFKPYERSNITRALRQLEKAGEVEVSPYLSEGRRCWSATKKRRPKQKLGRAPRLVVVGREAD